MSAPPTSQGHCRSSSSIRTLSATGLTIPGIPCSKSCSRGFGSPPSHVTAIVLADFHSQPVSASSVASGAPPELDVRAKERVQMLYHANQRKWAFVRRIRDGLMGYIPFAYCAPVDPTARLASLEEVASFWEKRMKKSQSEQTGLSLKMRLQNSNVSLLSSVQSSTYQTKTTKIQNSADTNKRLSFSSTTSSDSDSSVSSFDSSNSSSSSSPSPSPKRSQAPLTFASVSRTATPDVMKSIISSSIIHRHPSYSPNLQSRPLLNSTPESVSPSSSITHASTHLDQISNKLSSAAVVANLIILPQTGCGSSFSSSAGGSCGEDSGICVSGGQEGSETGPESTTSTPRIDSNCAITQDDSSSQPPSPSGFSVQLTETELDSLQTQLVVHTRQLSAPSPHVSSPFKTPGILSSPTNSFSTGSPGILSSSTGCIHTVSNKHVTFNPDTQILGGEHSTNFLPCSCVSQMPKSKSCVADFGLLEKCEPYQTLTREDANIVEKYTLV